MDLREIVWGVTYWIHLALDQWRALVKTAMNVGFRIMLNRSATGGF
jgi:hypothetical protein